MSEVVILVLDIGTSRAKGVLFNLSGEEILIKEDSIPLFTPAPGCVEQHPQQIWEAVLRVLGAVAEHINTQYSLRAVGLSTQGGSILPVSANGEPVDNLITWMDQRGQSAIQGWTPDQLDRIRQISGWTPQPGLPLPVLAAWKESYPDRYQKTAYYLSLNDFIIWNLTGQRWTDPSMAGETLLTDLQTGQYSPELCDLVGIKIEQLSPIQPAGKSCAEIKPEICQLIGIPPGTPLVGCGQDHACEGLALGLAEQDSFWLACGTAWVINGIQEFPNLQDIPSEMDLNPHVAAGRWIASQFLGGFGAGIEWWLNEVWPTGEQDSKPDLSRKYQQFNHRLLEDPSSGAGVVAIPPVGTIRGDLVRGGIWGIELGASVAELGRALLESAAFEVRFAIEEIQNHGWTIPGMGMIGGAASNPVWPQILADVLQIPIWLTDYSHGPARGAALLTARACDLEEQFPNRLDTPGISPRPDRLTSYDARYQRYLNFHQTLVRLS